MILVAALLIVGYAPRALPAAAQPDSPGTVTVTGDAEVRVVPDEVVLMLGVETWDKNLGRAKSENDEIVQRLLALAEDSGIESRHVQTEFLHIEPRYRDGYEKVDFIGYFVRKTVVVTLSDLALFESFLSQSLEAGATHVHGVEFRTTELRRYRDQARALAVNAAREKAEALCAELGQRVGEPKEIREEYSRWWSPYSSWWGYGWGSSMAQNVIQQVGEGGDVMGSLAPGQITVSASVMVVFEMRSDT